MARMRDKVWGAVVVAFGVWLIYFFAILLAWELTGSETLRAVAWWSVGLPTCALLATCGLMPSYWIIRHGISVLRRKE